MGDFADDTAIERLGEGRYRAELSRDWEIWGPMGGYVAAIAMRAAGAEATHRRPVSFYCHFLGPTKFDEIELRVETLRSGRAVESIRVHVTQAEREVMDATVCIVADNDGLEHEVFSCPQVPPPDDLRTLAALQAEADRPSFTFWSNFDARPIEFRSDWPPNGPEDPTWQQWHRLIPSSTFADPWTDAARYVMLCDLPSWPALMPQHAWKFDEREPWWIAPTLDLYVAFHRPVPADPWILVQGHVPVAAEGLLGCHARLWSSAGELVASGGGQGFFRPTPPQA
jgi:acyl-CoA thioesterase-2